MYNFHILTNETYFILTAKMSILGFKYVENITGNIELWRNNKTGKEFVIQRECKNIPLPIFESILDQADVTQEEYKSL